MKIRLKDNSLRIRLLRSEVDKLVEVGYLEERTSFIGNTLIYALKAIAEGTELTADYVDNKITMQVPAILLKDWQHNSVVGFNAKMPLGNAAYLSLLLEKDFVCSDETTEDQRDNFVNPNKVC